MMLDAENNPTRIFLAEIHVVILRCSLYIIVSVYFEQGRHLKNGRLARNYPITLANFLINNQVICFKELIFWFTSLEL